MNSLSQDFSERLGGLAASPQQPAWLADLRGRAGSLFHANGLPATNNERWKYTSLRALERRAPKLGFGKSGAQAGVVPAPLVAGMPRVAMVNGDYSLLDGPARPGVTVLPLEKALEAGNETLRRQLETLEIEDRAQGLSALNTAALGPGLFIHVARGTDAGALLLQWLSAPEVAGSLFNSRVCIQLEPGAKLELVEQFESGQPPAGAPGNGPILNLVLQCELGAGAAMRHIRSQQESSSSVLFTRTDVRQAADSHYDSTNLDVGGGLVRHDVRTRLEGRGASCELNGACLTRGRSHVDTHLDVDHIGPECKSTQLFRGVLGDRSRVVFNGRVFVAEGADGTEARQSSAGLLLSPHAEIDAKPELEIHADEVIASHGATVGQLDEDALFYLRSRGLDPQAARQLLTTAFCRSVIDRVASRPVREALALRLQAGLQAGGVTDD